MRAEDGTRTRDPRITNALLYQLSHFGKRKPLCFPKFAGAKIRKKFALSNFFDKNLLFFLVFPINFRHQQAFLPVFCCRHPGKSIKVRPSARD